MDRFVSLAVLESVSFTKKLMTLDLSNKENLFPDEILMYIFGQPKHSRN